MNLICKKVFSSSLLHLQHLFLVRLHVAPPFHVNENIKSSITIQLFSKYPNKKRKKSKFGGGIIYLMDFF